MFAKPREYFRSELENIKKSGLWKEEGIITGPQKARMNVTGRGEILNMCANNYLGLSSHPAVVEAAENSYKDWGYGLSSVRFICGTQEIHKKLEQKISEFLGTEDTILYTSCFDANGGLFETILSDQDTVISDELNHASIIDGIRLCKAARYRYKNNDMADLEEKLKEAQEKARHIHFPDDAENENVDAKTVDAALDVHKEFIAAQYDIIFGDGTFSAYL